MEIRCIWEHNGPDSLLYCESYMGAYTRGESREEALLKMPGEIKSYCRWLGLEPPEGKPVIAEEIPSTLEIRDADSDVLFESERLPLTMEEYTSLKALTLRSAADFHKLYLAIPDKQKSCLPPRKTFYGQIPRTAREMYAHTKSVNVYYFGEIGVDADNEGTILECRIRGFDALEATPDFLKQLPVSGSYGEIWSVRKVMRRFLWHDRIHAKAMYRMACRAFGNGNIPDVFRFEN